MAALYFQSLAGEYNFLATFSKWAFIDYTSFDRFIFSPTSWILWLSLAYRFIKDWLIHEQIQTKLKSEKISLELAFLKSQLNPHFLFNTLNNLYALALEEKAQRTADGVATMGALMRYSLHDSQTERILLSKEIDYLERYIELQKLRIVEIMDIAVTIDFQTNQITNEKIAPMILLPFIENAFKYGISTIYPSLISVVLRLKGNLLLLEVSNSIHHTINGSQGGIGLSNVRKRLQLIYPGQHTLECTKNNNTYYVRLEINIAE
jgi:LytS/YehU family sensor histidine kinase